MPVTPPPEPVLARRRSRRSKSSSPDKPERDLIEKRLEYAEAQILNTGSLTRGTNDHVLRLESGTYVDMRLRRGTLATLYCWKD